MVKCLFFGSRYQDPPGGPVKSAAYEGEFLVKRNNINLLMRCLGHAFRKTHVPGSRQCLLK